MGKRIVVVDDDPVVRLLMTECLSMHGHEVAAHDHGGAGLAWLTDHEAEVVFVDMMMPDMTGLELLKKIRALPEKASLPIVLLSANTDRKITHQDATAIPDRVLEKPWD